MLSLNIVVFSETPSLGKILDWDRH